jgi:hypothetical protein
LWFLSLPHSQPLSSPSLLFSFLTVIGLFRSSVFACCSFCRLLAPVLWLPVSLHV